MRRNTIKIYQGPSTLGPDDIMVLVSGLVRPSSNTATGPMLQCWILLVDTPPRDAQLWGDDLSTCGMCYLRPALKAVRETELPGRYGCYVKAWRLRALWEHGRKLPVTPMHEALPMLEGHRVRLGAYGDPCAVPGPYAFWSEIAGAAKAHTGYTRQWLDYPAMRHLVMASVFSASERDEAHALGWRTFRSGGANEEPGPTERLCSKEGSSVQCYDCLSCGGLSHGGPKSRFIHSHT